MTQGRLQQTTAQYLDQLKAHEATAERALNAAHMRTLQAIQPHLDRLYRQIAAKQQIGEEIPASWLYEEHRLEAIKQLITHQINHYAALAQITTGQLQHQGVQLGEQAALAQLQATGPLSVRYTFGVPSTAAINHLVGATQAGSPLADLFNGFGAEAADKVGSALITGLTLGNNPRVVARAVQQALGVSRNRALVISRQELLRAYRGANLAHFRANSEVVSLWRWVASKSSQTCALCLAMDGSLHDLSEDLNSHVCCRCVPVPVTKSWDDILGPLGIDTSGIRDVSNRPYQSGADWFEEQGESVQRQVLGSKAAYDLYNAGKVSLQDFVGVTHDKKWGTSRYVKPVKDLVK